MSGCDNADGAVVLGMSRSGTSLTTSLLVAAGFHAGLEAELMLADPSQPAGYFENTRFCEIHEEILAGLGATWLAPPPGAAVAAVKARELPRLEVALDQLRAYAGGRPIVVKDPRISGLLGLWDELIADRLHLVLAVRSPIEIALSMQARDGTPVACAIAGWELHMRRVLAFLDGRHVTVSPYAQLQRDPEVARIVVADVIAGLRPGPWEDLNPAAATGMVQPELYRNRAGDLAYPEYLTGVQIEIWEYLQTLEVGGQVLSVPLELLSRNESAAAALAKHEVERVESLSRIDRLEAEATHLRAQADELTRAEALERAALTGQVAALQAEAAALRAHCVRSDQTLMTIKGSMSWRMTQPLRTVKAARRRRADGELQREPIPNG
jgi:hypothetical protein